MKVNVCDRCLVEGNLVAAKWSLPLSDKVYGRVTGELCDAHVEEAKKLFMPQDVVAFGEWLLGKDRKELVMK